MAFRKQLKVGVIMKISKKIFIYIAPLLLFALLFVPYHFANQMFIVDIFGCGCPKTDELGNIVHPDFNANDFTALFWFFITVCATVISFFTSKSIMKKWLRLSYIICVFIISLSISYIFCQMMIWN